MTKPLSREKVLDILERNDFSQEFRLCMLRQEIESGNCDADEPALDVGELMKRLSYDKERYANHCEKSSNPMTREYWKGKEREAEDIINFIESKLKKPSEKDMAELKIDAKGDKVISAQINSADQYQTLPTLEYKDTLCKKCAGKNPIDADELMDWADNNLFENHDLPDGKLLYYHELENFVNSKLLAKEEKIKPCPWCATIPKINETNYDGYKRFYITHPLVPEEFCPIRSLHSHSYSEKEKAIAEWNKRL